MNDIMKQRTTLQTCTDPLCAGYGRKLWPSHESCPRCAGALVAVADVFAAIVAAPLPTQDRVDLAHEYLDSLLRGTSVQVSA